MLRNEDLEDAVKSGIITPEQRAALAKKAASAASSATTEDERFQVFRGFNDIFLTLGVGFITLAILLRWNPQDGTGFTLLTGAALIWGLSEILVGRRKAVLPGIASVLAIAFFCSAAAIQWKLIHGFDTATATVRDARSYPFSVWLAGAGAGEIAVVLYYLRFRLPFALFLVAAGIIATVIIAIINHFGLDTTRSLVNATALVMGLLTFLAALAFDASDPARVTRRSDCGFWLHLAAAPFIVHPAISMMATGSAAASALTTIGIVAVLAVVALIVDRRALLVSSLTYMGVAIGYLLHTYTNTGGTFGVSPSATTTLAILGAFVLFLGLGWHPLRRVLLAPFKGAHWLSYLPPVQSS